MVNNMNVEHPQNLALRHIVTSCALITYLTAAIKKGIEILSPEAQVIIYRNLMLKLQVLQ